MNKQCQLHPDTPLKFIPPGISKKTGKPYQGFEACAVPRCNGPIVATNVHPVGQMNSPKREPEYVTPHEMRNGHANENGIWDAKDRMHLGQTAANVVSTLHEGSGKTYEDLKPEMDKFFKWLLDKKKNGEEIDEVEIERE